ncbi:MAG TPA: TetR/AcrR family transcriptional regulator [Terriglobales bacterium]|nr:TetR/AcrR family transcriptional regulator [Terriglobales bacterium]
MILKAALEEFATEGVAGARTDAIARAAGVNKALLYYYFRSKESLYGAVMDSILEGLRDTLLESLAGERPPREKLARYVEAHFDYVARSAHLPRLIQYEFMRSGRKKSPHLRRFAQNYFVPIWAKLIETVETGIASGEFRQMDVPGFLVCMVGSIVNYFNTIPFALAMDQPNPLGKEALAAQKAATLDFVAHAVANTQNRESGNL